MPLYTDPTGIYYSSSGSSGSGSYSPYYLPNAYASYNSYTSRPLNYVLPSSSRTSSNFTSTSRYTPKLSTITETPLASRGLTSLTRINSPKVLTTTTTGPSFHHSSYIPPRPININTADIDVSASRFRRHGSDKFNSTNSDLNRNIESEISKPKRENFGIDINNNTDQLPPVAPKSDGTESIPFNRSTIKRNRAVVRLSTVRSRSPLASQNDNNIIVKKTKLDNDIKLAQPIVTTNNKTTPSWRERFGDDLNTTPKVAKKSPGELLLERHTIPFKEKSDVNIILNDLSKPTTNTNVLDVIEIPKELAPNDDDDQNMILEVDPLTHTAIRRLSIPKCPNFQDFCEDISSDKIDDDLNAGALRRRASLIQEQEIELLNELQKSASGSYQLIHLERVDSQADLRPSIKSKSKKKRIRHKITATVEIDNAPGLIKETINEEDNRSGSIKTPKISYNIDEIEENHTVHKVFKLPKKKVKQSKKLETIESKNAIKSSPKKVKVVKKVNPLKAKKAQIENIVEVKVEPKHKEINDITIEPLKAVQDEVQVSEKKSEVKLRPKTPLTSVPKSPVKKLKSPKPSNILSSLPNVDKILTSQQQQPDYFKFDDEAIISSKPDTNIVKPKTPKSAPIIITKESDDNSSTNLQRSDSGEDFWGSVGSRDTIYMSNRQKLLLEMQWKKCETLLDEQNSENVKNLDTIKEKVSNQKTEELKEAANYIEPLQQSENRRAHSNESALCDKKKGIFKQNSSDKDTQDLNLDKKVSSDILKVENSLQKSSNTQNDVKNLSTIKLIKNEEGNNAKTSQEKEIKQKKLPSPPPTIIKSDIKNKITEPPQSIITPKITCDGQKAKSPEINNKIKIEKDLPLSKTNNLSKEPIIKKITNEKCKDVIKKDNVITTTTSGRDNNKPIVIESKTCDDKTNNSAYKKSGKEEVFTSNEPTINNVNVLDEKLKSQIIDDKNRNISETGSSVPLSEPSKKIASIEKSLDDKKTTKIELRSKEERSNKIESTNVSKQSDISTENKKNVSSNLNSKQENEQKIIFDGKNNKKENSLLEKIAANNKNNDVHNDNKIENNFVASDATVANNKKSDNIVPVVAAAKSIDKEKSTIDLTRDNSNQLSFKTLLNKNNEETNNLTKFATVSNLNQCLQDVDAELDDYKPSDQETDSSYEEDSSDYSSSDNNNTTDSMKHKDKKHHKKAGKDGEAKQFNRNKVKLDHTKKLYVKDEPAPKYQLIATPRPLWNPEKFQKHSDSDSDDSSGDETDSDSECSTTSGEESEDELNPQKSAIIRMSTCSNDSGFEGGTAPSSPKKMLGPHDARDSPSTPPSHNPAYKIESNNDADEYDETSYTYAQFQKSGRITAPATNIPRFKKYSVEDFHFLAVLGKGSFGKVLLAELRNTDYYYAVKCLKKDVVLEDDDVECTLIERKVLALGTKHPYLCHLFCTFQTESHLFFVMEYLNGGDLMFHIQQSGRFTESRARFYAAEIISGLKFLHKKGIIYRDLKLDNVLLDFDGHVRIADFGMCKLQIYLDKTADSFCGTPDYMAPEIIKGDSYNQNVDWWSFGVLVYEMLIGQSPFSGCDEEYLFWSICNETPLYPMCLSQEATSLLKSLLEKDSSKRIGSQYSPAGDVCAHIFFREIEWDKLETRQIEPPFKPQVKHPLDTKYFDKTFTRERVRLTPIDKEILQSMDQAQFQGFSYTNPNATLE